MRKPGRRRPPAYYSWIAMRRYCGLIRGATAYQLSLYEGVSVCPEWRFYASFREWALLHGWFKGAHLTRKDKDGDFCPENCVWLDVARANGMRSCIRRLPDGRSARDILGDERLGLDHIAQGRLAGRLFGWDRQYPPKWGVEEALHVPKCTSGHMARRERAKFRANKERTEQ